MKATHYVSLSKRVLGVKTRYRVALKYFSGDLNSLDRTLGEETFRSRDRAEELATRWAAEFVCSINRNL